jgi:hypothetical protein
MGKNQTAGLPERLDGFIAYEVERTKWILSIEGTLNECNQYRET